MIARTSHYVTTMLSTLLLFIVIPGLQAHDSPVFTLETITTTNSKITVSVSAADFTNISGGNLKLLYNCNVAVPTAVTIGPDLKGTCDFNLSEPGVIRIGWFAFPAENLPDGTVVFDIEFRKVAYGTSEIRFDNAFGNMDCQFYDGNHNQLNDKPFDKFYISGSLSFEHRGVITSVPNLIVEPGEQVIIPVTVNNFQDIGAVSLILKYDRDVLEFISAENTGAYPGMKIYNPLPGIITVSGTVNNPEGFSLPDAAELFSVTFQYMGGTTDLDWHDDGTSCEYAGPLSDYIIPDTPKFEYYQNGRIGSCSAPDKPVLVLEQPNCETTTGTIKISSPIDENLSYSIDGTNYQSSHIFSGLKSGSYGVTAKNNTGCISPVTDAVITEEPVVPEPPRVNVVYSACGEEGIAGIINFDSTYTYIFDPPGPVPDDNGNIMDFETGQSYTLKANNSYGCEGLCSEPFIIHDNEAPEPVITITYSGKLCEAGCLTLTASKGESYLWSTGDTTQSIPAISSGSYSVEVTYITGCKALSKPLPIIISQIESNINQNNLVELNVYPNPFTDRVTFKFSSNKPAKVFIGIYDLTGRLILIIKREIDGGMVYYEEFAPEFPNNNVFYYKASIGNFLENGKLIYEKQ